MLTAAYLWEQFAAGLPYDRYVKSGTEEQARRWQQVYELARLTDALVEEGSTRHDA